MKKHKGTAFTKPLSEKLYFVQKEEEKPNANPIIVVMIIMIMYKNNTADISCQGVRHYCVLFCGH